MTALFLMKDQERKVAFIELPSRNRVTYRVKTTPNRVFAIAGLTEDQSAANLYSAQFGLDVNN
jgi:hypothetical protein